MIIIFILIVAIVVGILLSGVMAPIIVANNRKKLREMREIVDHYDHNRKAGFADPEAARRATRNRLLALRRKVWPGDKASTAEAHEIFRDFDLIPQ